MAMKNLMTVLRMVVVVAAVAWPVVAGAQTPATHAESDFRFELEDAQSPHRGRGVEGYLYNGLPWRITNVRLRVESLDATGTVTGEGSGWVLGDVRAGGRGYFFFLVSPGATSYRATVQSFDRVMLEAPRLEAP
jgi:hypothetical protein